MADIFDRDGDGYIDYYEFVAALHPNKDAYKPLTDADKIEDEVLPPFYLFKYILLELLADIIVPIFSCLFPQFINYMIVSYFFDR